VQTRDAGRQAWQGQPDGILLQIGEMLGGAQKVLSGGQQVLLGIPGQTVAGTADKETIVWRHGLFSRKMIDPWHPDGARAQGLSLSMFP